MQAFPNIFLAGTPASGKSHFGDWLETNHGFVHIDAEKPGELARLDLHSSWEHLLRTGDGEEFLLRLAALGRPVVFNWGFPLRFLLVVRRLIASGFIPCWFDADVKEARRLFLRRAGVDPEAFEIQVAQIERRRSDIQSTFAPNIFHVLNGLGEHTPPEEIYASLRAAA